MLCFKLKKPANNTYKILKIKKAHCPRCNKKVKIYKSLFWKKKIYNINGEICYCIFCGKKYKYSYMYGYLKII